MHTRVGLLCLALFAAPLCSQGVFYTWNGVSPFDFLGTSVSGAGDVNGDGFDDVIAGAPGADVQGSDSGSARVFSGLDGSVLYTWNGDAAQDEFGKAVSGAGDVNGDGFMDLIVGAHWSDTSGQDAGAARVFSGLDGSILYTWNGVAAGDEFGIAVGAAGDVNGDGLGDVIVGARGQATNGAGAGGAYLFSGLDGSLLQAWFGDAAGDLFGSSVGGAGDVNGDGCDDLIVGAPLHDSGGADSGEARLFSGLDGSVLHTWLGAASGDVFGSSVSGAGDVNGDGVPDLIVGAFLADNQNMSAGSARVLSGLDGSTLYTWFGDTTESFMGVSVAGAGDVNLDGFADLLVGAHGAGYNGPDSGSARLFSGLDGSVIFNWLGDSHYDYLGTSVSAAGDLNGDGIPDLLAGAPFDDNTGPGSGSMRSFSGARALDLVAPATAPVGSPMVFTINSSPPLANASLLFDVSFAGSSPGLPLPAPLVGSIPLNPPLLNLTFGALLPAAFVGFQGALDPAGQGMAIFNLPNIPALTGLVLSSAALTLDPAAPFGLGMLSNGQDTTLTAAVP